MNQEQVYRLEFWADSFHEGHWACENLRQHLKLIGVNFLHGFVPHYRFALPGRAILEIIVLGSYKSWSPLPARIAELLDWGKPDLVVYDPERAAIVATFEETAAVPTGNQALQRCERMYGSAHLTIPFWYLLPEYGLHIDQGERRDSIWPTVFALKLTAKFGVPCVVLHYAEQGKPETYDAGPGLNFLFASLTAEIQIHFRLVDPSSFLPALKEQYRTMLGFIRNHWKDMTRFLPGEEFLDDPQTAESFARRALGYPMAANLTDFLVWGPIDTIPPSIMASLRPGKLIKQDDFLGRLEGLVGKSCYTLSEKTGARTQPEKRIEALIKDQHRRAEFSGIQPPASFSLDIAQFPQSEPGFRYLATAKNILYLCDRWSDVLTCLLEAYPRLAGLKERKPPETPTMVYVSNSIVPGRIFGDPFTGQLAAYSFIFAKGATGHSERLVLTYFPHQVHNQLFRGTKTFRKNKGITIMRELADLGIFHGGVAVDFRTGDVI